MHVHNFTNHVRYPSPPPQVISSCLRREGSVKVLTFPGKDLTHLKMATLKLFLFMQKHTIHKIQTLIL